MHQRTIELNAISHTYLGARAICALEGITLKIAAGEVVAVVGQSGCGKTTLAKIISGLIKPTEGLVTVGTEPAVFAREARRFGVVFQKPVLLAWRSIRENLRLPFELRAARRDSVSNSLQTIDERINSLTEAMGIADFLDARPFELSGGMQARAAIARALVYNPEVLVMDEPFGSLDEVTRERLNVEFLSLQKSTGVTTVIITHSLREAAFLADRVVVLTPRPGRIAAVFCLPAGIDRLHWRDSSEFSARCRELRSALGD